MCGASEDFLTLINVTEYFLDDSKLYMCYISFLYEHLKYLKTLKTPKAKGAEPR